MFLENFLNKYNNKNIKLFVDMDGVIADYDVGKASKYDQKRPLLTSISKLEKISKKDNIELYILSISKINDGIKEKNIWLDKYAPFFKKENRIIISKESNQNLSSKELKSNYFNSFELSLDPNDIIIFIDDDPRIIKEVRLNHPNIIILKDTALVD